MTNKETRRLPKFAVFAWAVLGYNLLVIVWGAYVRATGSGAGCGDHWPLCNGEIVPRAPQIATLIELSHRLTSGVALLLVVALAVWALFAYPRRHRVRRGAALSLLFILTEALVGAGLVLFQLVAENASMARALFMSVHLTNTFILIAVLSITAWWASGGAWWRWREGGRLNVAFVVALLAMIVLGISGAVTALGDTLFPVSSFAEGWRQDFSPTAHVLIRLRILHPTIAVAVSAYLIALAVAAAAHRPDRKTKQLSAALIALIVVQIGAGLLNVALLAPVWLQLLHLLLADLNWIAVVLLAASALADPSPIAEQTASASAPRVLQRRPATEEYSH